MILNNLPKSTTKRAKRLGQGYGSGKARTSGRGQKGQKARGTIPTWFEGGQLPLIRRTPFLRGKGRFQSLTSNALIITLTQLNNFPADSTVDAKALTAVLKMPAKRIEKDGVKVVCTGTLERSLKVALRVTASAKAAIETAGGSVIGQTVVK